MFVDAAAVLSHVKIIYSLDLVWIISRTYQLDESLFDGEIPKLQLDFINCLVLLLLLAASNAFITNFIRGNRTDNSKKITIIICFHS